MQKFIDLWVHKTEQLFQDSESWETLSFPTVITNWFQVL